MEKIKSIFGKSEGPTFESMDGTTYRIDDNDNDEYDNYYNNPEIKGVGDQGLDTNGGYRYSETNQVQTEMFMPRKTDMSGRQWGEPEFTPHPLQQVEGLSADFRAIQFEGVNMMYVEESEIDAISEDIKILGEIAQDISVLLDDQGCQIKKIDTHVEKANINVVKAGAEVNKTLHLMKSAKYKKGAITTTGCAVIGGAIGALGGPLGIAIGAGVGGAVGLVGSTVAIIF